jgi:hypothetical protein
MPKESAVGSVWIDVDSVARETQGLWLRVTADSISSQSADMNVRMTINRVGTITDIAWTAGSLSTGSFTKYGTFGQPTTPVNVTVGDKIWLTFFPDCDACSSTVEFSVETAWYYAGSTQDNYPNITLLNNTRTMVFEEPQGTYLPFFTVVAGSSAFFYTSVVFDNKATTGSSEIVLYWTKDAPFTGGNGTYLDIYPFGDGITAGNYLTQRPFTANSSGIWFLTTYVKTGASVGLPEFTIKVGFNSIPCSSGSVLSISLFLALLPFLASLWN